MINILYIIYLLYMSSNYIQTKLDDSNFPIIKITLGTTIKDEDDFNNITNFWLKQYLHKKFFYIVFDTSNIKKLPLTYLYKLGKFVGNLKKIKIQYLKTSIILIKSNFVRKLYSLYLKIQGPLSKIYIVKEENDIYIITSKLLKNENILGYTEYNP